MNRKIPKWVLPLFGALAGLCINNFFLLGSVIAQDRGYPFWFMAIFFVIQFFGAWLLTISLLSLGSMKERADSGCEQRP